MIANNNNLRKVSLEIDKLDGTEFPPQSISFGGNNITLESMYLEAEVDLHIE